MPSLPMVAMDLFSPSGDKIYSAALNNDVLNVGFGSPASAQELVDAAKSTWTPEALAGLQGMALKINGAMSLPLAILIALPLKNTVSSLSVWIPKDQMYVQLI